MRRACPEQGLVPVPVRAAMSAQWPVTAGLGAVGDSGTLPVCQGLLLHVAQVARAARMAAFAPARAVARAVVVVHRFNRKTGRARVAGVTVQAGAAEQLSLIGDVIIRLGQSRPTRVVTSGAGPGRYTRVIEHSIGEGRVTRVAVVARGRGGDVVARLAEGVPGGVGAVVAGRTLAGHDALRRRMGERRRRERARVMARIA